MQTLTQYLSNIMNTVLLGLPTEIKELIYFDALSHAATKILVKVSSFDFASLMLMRNRVYPWRQMLNELIPTV